MTGAPTKTRIDLALASGLAAAACTVLNTRTERIEIAGSIRRQSITVGDIDLVCIARAGSIRRQIITVGDIDLVCIVRHEVGFFPGQEGLSKLDPAGVFDLAAALSVALDRAVTPGRAGHAHQQFHIHSRTGTGLVLPLELWITTPPQWGVILTIRTGPEAFSRRLVTERGRGGLLPDGAAVQAGRLWAHATRDAEGRVLSVSDPIPTPEEEDLFTHLAGGYVPPEKRF